MFKSFTKIGRVEAIDLLKLFASFLVIFSHCMLKYIVDGTTNPVFNFIWLTQMPLFMFASGFVNNKPEKVSAIGKYFLRLAKNALVLLVPCITFLLITCAINGSSVLDSFYDFYLNPETNLWFLWVLFVIHAVFDLGLYLSSKTECRVKKLIPLFVSAVVFMLIAISMLLFKDKFDFSILSLKLVVYYLPFYCLGYLFFLLVVSGLLQKNAIKIICVVTLCIFATILLFECFYFKSIYTFDDYSVKYLLIRTVGSISSVFVCCFLADLAVRLSFIAKLSKYGAFSLQSYYLHIIFLRFMAFSVDSAPLQWLLSLGVGLLLIVLVALTIMILYFIPYAHLTLFGRSFSFYKFEKKLPKLLR